MKSFFVFILHYFTVKVTHTQPHIQMDLLLHKFSVQKRRKKRETGNYFLIIHVLLTFEVPSL